MVTLNKKCLAGIVSQVLILFMICLYIHHDKIFLVKFIWTMKSSVNLCSDVCSDSKKLDSPSSEFGYIMATHYSDQMTGSAANLVSLQCWASTLGPDVRVVEPFIHHSRLGVNLDAASDASVPETEDNSLRLRDVFDIEDWERQYSKEMRFSSLVSWHQFLSDAKRKLILIHKECHTGSKCQHQQAYYKASELFATKYNFIIIRRACYPRKISTESDFKALVYGSNDPKDVVVMFYSWGGVQMRNHTNRVGISGRHVNKCQREKCLRFNQVSKTIKNDALSYLKRNMPQSINNGYISIMIRLQYFIINHDSFRGLTMAQVLALITKCFDNIISHLNELKREYGISDVFLTSDCSKHGSSFFQLKHSQINDMMIEATARLYDHIYNRSLNLGSSDEIFDRLASFNASGYIAILQKHLAAKGTCVLTAGGGQFQSTARELHSIYHPTGSPCTLVVPNC